MPKDLSRKRKKHAKAANSGKPLKLWEREEIEVGDLALQIKAIAPPAGAAAPLADPSGDPLTFESLPLCWKTQQGVAAAGYETLTEIQAAVLPHALAERDVLGSARTGSGKTLAARRISAPPVLSSAQG